MVRALLYCSDGDCDAVYEVLGPLAEIETLACDCGCGLEIVGLPDPETGCAARPLELEFVC